MKLITEVVATTNRPAWLTVTSYLGWLAVGSVAALTLAGFLAELWWVFDLTTHFHTQYLVATTVLAVAALAFRRFAMAVCAAALPLASGATATLTVAADQQAAALPFRLAALEVRDPPGRLVQAVYDNIHIYPFAE